MPRRHVTVVGSGLYGLTIADLCARESGCEVTIIESRNHIGGNAWSEIEPTSGIEYHPYGTHIFHTSNQRVIDYVSRFTRFNTYRHVVWSRAGQKVYSLPFGLLCLSQMYGKHFTPDEARKLLNEFSRMFPRPRNLEEKALASVGPEIYETLIKGYTLKQWGTDPTQLPPETIARLPVRLNYDNSYFSDTFEGIPLNGYRSWLSAVIDHRLIKVELGVKFDRGSAGKPSDENIVVYTGALDEYYGYEHGYLSWRTVDLEFELIDTDDALGCAVLNYADATEPRTRSHEFKHLHPERSGTRGTLLGHEYSRMADPGDEPYYPVNTPADKRVLKRYRAEASRERYTLFGGRLATYKYLDMHMAIASAMATYEGKLRFMLI